MVKIKEHKLQRKTALMSLIVALAAALSTFVGWRVWREEKVAAARQRDITDVIVTWECPSGYRFEGPGGCTPLPCEQEGEVADIVLTCECPRHGRFEAYVRYEPDETGRARLSEVRFDGGPWEPVEDGVRCPRCGRRAEIPKDMDWFATRSAKGR